MICNKCKEFGHFQELSEGKCSECGKPTPTRHLPANKVCKKCSLEHSICEECGQPINK